MAFRQKYLDRIDTKDGSLSVAGCTGGRIIKKSQQANE